MLLNIYYFRFNIFNKDTFKRPFEKKRAYYQKTLGGGANAPSAPLFRRTCKRLHLLQKKYLRMFFESQNSHTGSLLKDTKILQSLEQTALEN